MSRRTRRKKFLTSVEVLELLDFDDSEQDVLL